MRGAFRHAQPVAVLVDHWTGSMGEGLAIGFDARPGQHPRRNADGRFAGATEHLQLANTGIGINLPTERLYQRRWHAAPETFVPRVRVDVSGAVAGRDPRFIAAALQRLGAEVNTRGATLCGLAAIALWSSLALRPR